MKLALQREETVSYVAEAPVPTCSKLSVWMCLFSSNLINHVLPLPCLAETQVPQPGSGQAGQERSRLDPEDDTIAH